MEFVIEWFVIRGQTARAKDGVIEEVWDNGSRTVRNHQSQITNRKSRSVNFAAANASIS
jgi:hypothetical protein